MLGSGKTMQYELFKMSNDKQKVNKHYLSKISISRWKDKHHSVHPAETNVVGALTKIFC